MQAAPEVSRKVRASQGNTPRQRQTGANSYVHLMHSFSWDVWLLNQGHQAVAEPIPLISHVFSSVETGYLGATQTKKCNLG